MTFEEFYKLYENRHDKYTKLMIETIYNLGPATWCSDIKTKKLVTMNWTISPIRYSEISVTDEIERRKQYKLLSKLSKEQKKLEQMKDDFQ